MVALLILDMTGEWYEVNISRVAWRTREDENAFSKNVIVELRHTATNNGFEKADDKDIIEFCNIRDEYYLDKKCLTFGFVYADPSYSSYANSCIRYVPQDVVSSNNHFVDYVEWFITYLSNMQLTSGKSLSFEEMIAAEKEFILLDELEGVIKRLNRNN